MAKTKRRKLPKNPFTRSALHRINKAVDRNERRGVGVRALATDKVSSAPSRITKGPNKGQWMVVWKRGKMGASAFSHFKTKREAEAFRSR